MVEVSLRTSMDSFLWIWTITQLPSCSRPLKIGDVRIFYLQNPVEGCYGRDRRDRIFDRDGDQEIDSTNNRDRFKVDFGGEVIDLEKGNWLEGQGHVASAHSTSNSNYILPYPDPSSPKNEYSYEYLQPVNNNNNNNNYYSPSSPYSNQFSNLKKRTAIEDDLIMSLNHNTVTLPDIVRSKTISYLDYCNRYGWCYERRVSSNSSPKSKAKSGRKPI